MVESNDKYSRLIFPVVTFAAFILIYRKFMMLTPMTETMGMQPAIARDRLDAAAAAAVVDRLTELPMTLRCLDRVRKRCEETVEKLQKDAPETGVQQLAFSHVINPFPTSDAHFNFTVRSMISAIRYAKQHGVFVEVLGVAFAGEALVLPPEIRILSVIPNNRTAGGVIQQLGT